MKKLALTIAIFLGISLSTYAQGLFQYGEASDENKLPTWYSLDQNGSLRDGDDPLLPGLPGHGEDDNQGAPLGSGAMLLIGFGAAYALKRRQK